MYKIYIDRPETFEATIQIEGADSTNSLCRLVIESKNYSLLFEGKIENGNVKVPIPTLKSILKEGDSGKIKLEVIAEDTFFTPWEQEYETKLSKKVTAEVVQPTLKSNKPIVEVTQVKNSQTTPPTFINYLTEQFKKNNISFINVKDNIKLIKKITSEGAKKFDISPDSPNILNGVTTALKNIDIT